MRVDSKEFLTLQDCCRNSYIGSGKILLQEDIQLLKWKDQAPFDCDLFRIGGIPFYL